MKAISNNVMLQDEKVPGVPKGKSLVKKEELTNKFGIVKTRIDEYEEISTKIRVNDSDTSVIAENHVSSIQEMINNIETVRKTLKGPYFETSKTIDAYAKVLKDPLERAKKRISIELTSYKEVQQATARLESERAEEERIKKESTKIKEIEILTRINKQMYARIYGGIYYVKDGIRKSNAGCITLEDCKRTEEFLRNKFPKPSEFNFISEEVEKSLEDGLKSLREYQSYMIDLQSMSKSVRSEAQTKINEAKIKAEVEITDNNETLKKQITKDSRKDEIKNEKLVKEAGKGVRQFLKFKVEDQNLVPVDFKVVDEKLINEYISSNKERIKESLTKNKQLIPGIKFYVDSKFISR